MNHTPTYTFYGDLQHHPVVRRHPDAPQQPELYLATPELVQAVNFAISSNRLIFLQGETGTGKTSLALAVAYELGLPLYRWDICPTSKAQDGLYHYDAALRLQDLQRLEQQKSSKLTRDPCNPIHYRTFGAIGKAFQLKDCPAVVLIDEIDQADIDFANDLLDILDEPWAFA